MARRRQRLANQVGLSRIVIQDSNSHNTPQRDILRNWWPANRQMTGMTAQSTDDPASNFIFGCTFFD
jgi:hypothetical protein